MPGKHEIPVQIPRELAAPDKRPATVVPVETTGDLAVDGLLWGLGAGVVMGLYLIVLSLAQGQAAGAAFQALGLPGAAAFLTSLLGHLAVAGVYGAVWALIYRWILRRAGAPAWVWGIVYGAALFVIAWLAALPADLGRTQTGHMLAAHLIYGLVLGIFAQSAWNR